MTLRTLLLGAVDRGSQSCPYHHYQTQRKMRSGDFFMFKSLLIFIEAHSSSLSIAPVLIYPLRSIPFSEPLCLRSAASSIPILHLPLKENQRRPLHTSSPPSMSSNRGKVFPFVRMAVYPNLCLRIGACLQIGDALSSNSPSYFLKGGRRIQHFENLRPCQTTVISNCGHLLFPPH
jgi:hypothetical protein